MRRFLLLLPLPVIAGWVAYSGLVYMPDELQLKLQKITTTLIRMPDKASGFERVGKVRAYTRDSLYEYVNGHAEFFISSGFVSLTVADYSSDGKGEVTVELYDMELSQNVRAVLDSEKGSGEAVESLGFPAYSQEGSFIFGKGRYYVRLGLFNLENRSDANRLAVGIAGLIKGGSAVSAKLHMPLGGRVKGSESFVKSDYMGLSFLSEVTTARYGFDGLEFEAFELQKPPDALLRFYKNEKSYLEDFPFEGFKRIVIEDKYEGTINLITNGSLSVGIRGEVSQKFLKSFMGEVAENFRGGAG